MYYVECCRGFGKEDDFTGQEIDCVCELHGSSSRK